MDNILGKRIELERTRLGLNQIELAKKLDLSSSASISQYEKGDRIPSDDIKLKMTEIFNCSLDYLLGKTSLERRWKQMKRKLDTNKIYNFIGRAVVYSSLYIATVAFSVWAFCQNTIY